MCRLVTVTYCSAPGKYSQQTDTSTETLNVNCFPFFGYIEVLNMWLLKKRLLFVTASHFVQRSVRAFPLEASAHWYDCNFFFYFAFFLLSNQPSTHY